jgi:hypothetical protein
VVAQRAQVALGVGEQAGVDVPLDDLALDLEAVAGELQELVEAAVQRRLIALEAGAGRS